MPTTSQHLHFTGDNHSSGSIRFGSIDSMYTLCSESSSLSIKIFESGSTIKEALFITASGDDAKIGIGTTDPKSFLDVRGNTGTETADIVLRTSKPSDTKIAVGDETGRISFVIESSSFIDGKTKSQFINSGSSAEIFSRIIDESGGAAYGSLIFSVNDNTNTTDPTEALTIGHNTVGGVDGVSLIASGAIKIAHNNPRILFEDTATGNQAAFIGGKSVPNANEGVLELYDNGTKTIQLDGGLGNISASGEIIGIVNGGTF